MVKRKLAAEDDLEFLRRRAAELWEEGLEEEARKLVDIIDEEQIRHIVALEEKRFRASRS